MLDSDNDEDEENENKGQEPLELEKMNSVQTFT